MGKSKEKLIRKIKYNIFLSKEQKERAISGLTDYLYRSMVRRGSRYASDSEKKKLIILSLFSTLLLYIDIAAVLTQIDEVGMTVVLLMNAMFGLWWLMTAVLWNRYSWGQYGIDVEFFKPYFSWAPVYKNKKEKVVNIEKGGSKIQRKKKKLIWIIEHNTTISDDLKARAIETLDDDIVYDLIVNRKNEKLVGPTIATIFMTALDIFAVGFFIWYIKANITFDRYAWIELGILIFISSFVAFLLVLFTMVAYRERQHAEFGLNNNSGVELEIPWLKKGYKPNSNEKKSYKKAEEKEGQKLFDEYWDDNDDWES